MCDINIILNQFLNFECENGFRVRNESLYIVLFVCHWKRSYYVVVCINRMTGPDQEQLCTSLKYLLILFFIYDNLSFK